MKTAIKTSVTRIYFLPDPEDFTETQVMLTFSPSISRACVDILITDDDISEDPEDFPVVLISDDPDVTTTTPTTTVTIIDDDAVTIGFEMETYPALEDQGTVEVCARLMEGTLDREVVITFLTEDGSAQDPGDYTSVSVTLTFDELMNRRCEEILLENDMVLEGVEEFDVILESDEERVTLVLDRAVVRITDDDGKVEELI